MRPIPATLLILALVAAGVSARALTTSAVGSVTRVAVDVDTGGNTATSLGATQTCASISNGATLVIDIIVNSDVAANNPGIAGFNFNLGYNADVLNATAHNYSMLLDSGGGTIPLPLGDAVPDADGSFLVAFADFGPEAEGGSGVISRITVQAVGPGASTLALTSVEVSDALAQSLITAGTTIEGAEVRVGSPCPGATASPTGTTAPTAPATSSPTATPTPSPTVTPPLTPSQTATTAATATATATTTPATSAAPTDSPAGTTPSQAATATPSATHTPTPTIIGETASPTPTELPTIKGDADCDGEVTPFDALAILLEAATDVTLPCGEAADVNCDGVADTADMLAILSWLGELNPTLPVGCPAIASA